jgi:hypothetical protein
MIGRLPITVCERCQTTEASCDAKRLFSGRPCCPSCDHDGGNDAA